MDKLSICFVSQEYPEETGWGGIGTYTHEMAHGLARAGHTVAVLARALSEPSYEIEADGVHVYRVLPRFSLNGVPALWRLNRLWEGYNVAVASKLREMIATHQIDLIEAPELHAETLFYTLTRGNPVPTVIRLHGGTGLVLNYEKHQHQKSKFAKRLERQVVSRAALVTAPSTSVLEVSRGWLPVGTNASVIPNPVNTQMFSPNGGGPDETEPQIVCVGTPRYVKGLHVLARAIPLVWRVHPEARFVFVAPLKSDQETDAFRAVLGDLYGHRKIELRSRVAHADMPDIYRHATMCVVPSLWPEPFGYSCAEPMACGVPVVASRVGGLAEMITDGQTGVLVEPDNATALAQAINGLLRDEAKRSDLGRQAREKINSDFSTRVILPRMEAVYQAVSGK